MENFKDTGGIDPNNMTPEQIAADEALIAEIRARAQAKETKTSPDNGFEFMKGDRDERTNERQDRPVT